MTTEANTAQVEELRNLLRRFISEKGRTKVCEFSSVAEYVVKCLKVGDIEPVECTRSPAHDNMNNVRGVLSFFTQPLLVHNQCIAPTQTIKSCRSTYYSPSSLPVGLTSVLRDFVDTKIPAWIRDIHEKVHTTPLSKETLIANISNDFVWYDHFPVSLRVLLLDHTIELDGLPKHGSVSRNRTDWIRGMDGRPCSSRPCFSAVSTHGL